jgi:cyclohexyl-isocyanide hydratase
VAKQTQLVMEYDPQPPFDAGSPDKAGPKIVQTVRAMLDQAMPAFQ